MIYSGIDGFKGDLPVNPAMVICSRRVRLFILYASSGTASGGYRNHSI